MRKARAATIFAFALMAVGVNAAEKPQPLALRSESRLWLEGDSTLHPYKSTATVLELSGAASGGDLASSIRERKIEGRINIPVKGLKSGEKGLDKNMYKALKAEANPVISFRLTSFALDSVKDGGAVVRATGTLSIAGKEREIELAPILRLTSDGAEIAGNQKILMSDYGIKPPALMMGMLKVRDLVVVHFDLFVDIAKDSKESKQERSVP